MVTQPEVDGTQYRVYPEYTDKVLSITFAIKVIEAGGYEQTFTGPFELQLECGEDTVSTMVQSVFDHNQNVEMYLTMNPVFFFVEYGNDAGCENSYSVIDFNEVVDYGTGNQTWVARVQD